jgi:NhaP-type Na+/H+ or K+/H+ antiporter
MQELLRPWKLVTLAIGLGLLIVGSFIFEAPDWDIPVSILMAAVAYVTAPWCMRVMVERRWRHWPAMLFLTWFGVDGCYAAYWSIVNPVALEQMRSANAPASLSLFWMVGLFWMYKGSLREFVRDAAEQWRGGLVRTRSHQP